ncbi:hypothetical protein B0H13DRAFT_2014519 [Mycena leptocephala]|nr:hypothetical protein B0H13DRAFT_2014519 [Mycena leptocephala]
MSCRRGWGGWVWMMVRRLALIPLTEHGVLLLLFSGEREGREADELERMGGSPSERRCKRCASSLIEDGHAAGQIAQQRVPMSMSCVFADRGAEIRG